MIAKCVESIRRVNPGWEMKLHTDEDWKHFLEGHPIMDSQHFERFPTGIQKADVFRCLALYESGGIYADVDVLGVRPLDSLLDAAVESGLIAEDTEMILTTDHPIHSQLFHHGREVLMNHFMVAVPRARFLKLYLEHMRDFVADGYKGSTEPVGTTGPVAMTHLIEKHGGVEALKIAVVPYFWINPLPDMMLRFPERQAFHEILTDGTWKARFCPYLVHCWWHSYWVDHNMMTSYQEALFGREASRIEPASA